MVRMRAQHSEDVCRVEEKEKRVIGMWDVRDITPSSRLEPTRAEVQCERERGRRTGRHGGDDEGERRERRNI